MNNFYPEDNIILSLCNWSQFYFILCLIQLLILSLTLYIYFLFLINQLIIIMNSKCWNFNRKYFLHFRSVLNHLEMSWMKLLPLKYSKVKQFKVQINKISNSVNIRVLCDFIPLDFLFFK